MDTPLNSGNGVGFVELKTEGYFKMQIRGFLNVMVVNHDQAITQGDIPGIVENISARVELKPESDRSLLPSSHLTVYKLARWFVENQQSHAAPQKPS